ncbi:MAG: hypothetical protein KA761_08885 [Gemmatimonadaceae bacterium]|nr:hypothetical protein [Gemmatimonadaceae bacterium]
MAYTTQTLLENAYGADVVAELTGSDAARLARMIADASARVRTALQIGGYAAAVPETVYAADASDCPVEITELTARVWKRIAYAARDLSIPLDQLRDVDTELRDMREGMIEIKGLARSVSRAPGGFLSSDSDPESTDENARPQVFKRSRMTGW